MSKEGWAVSGSFITSAILSNKNLSRLEYLSIYPEKMMKQIRSKRLILLRVSLDLLIMPVNMPSLKVKKETILAGEFEEDVSVGGCDVHNFRPVLERNFGAFEKVLKINKKGTLALKMSMILALSSLISCWFWVYNKECIRSEAHSTKMDWFLSFSSIMGNTNWRKSLMF